MWGNSGSCYVETDATAGPLGGKNDSKHFMGITSPAGKFQNYPTKLILIKFGNNLGDGIKRIGVDGAHRSMCYEGFHCMMQVCRCSGPFHRDKQY